MMDVEEGSPLERAKVARKRARTAVACRRCKSRKQKCCGSSPRCSNCANSAQATCEYDLSTTLHRNHDQYLRARRRVDELEGILSRLGGANEGGPTNLPSSAATFSPELGGSSTTVIEDSATVPSSSSLSGGDDGCPKSPEFVDVLRHLSVQATGGGCYVDSSSTVTLGRMLQAVVTPKTTINKVADGCFLEQNLSPKSLDVLAQSNGSTTISLAGIPDVVADRMLEKGYYNYIATLWPLMQPKVLTALHKQRASLEDRFEMAALHLVYAAAGRFLETTGETGSLRSEKHYQAATTLLPEIMTLNGSLQTVQILLLLAIYSLRAPRGPGAWSFVGTAMRMCIGLGLHRKRKDEKIVDVKDEELRRRVFWSCYCLDRQVSLILGRPFAVSDRDIDVELPTGADGEYAEDSTACFVHLCRLRIIESNIQQTMYRVDEPLYTHTSSAGIQNFIDQLERWKSSIPLHDHVSSSSSTNNVDSYLVYYYQAVRYLLHPYITSSSGSHDQYMAMAANACGGICQTYKRLHQNVTVGFSLMALHSVFFAGLSLLYCAWKSPASVLTNSTRTMIHDCSIVLYIITERWPGAKRYRDLYEAIKDPVLDTIEQHVNTPQTTVEQLQPHLHEALRSMHPAESGQQEFSAMLMEMSGEISSCAPPHQHHQQHHYNNLLADDISIMPGLAFDFSLPTDTETLSQFHSFSSEYQSWIPETDPAQSWTSKQGFSRSL